MRFSRRLVVGVLASPWVAGCKGGCRSSFDATDDAAAAQVSALPDFDTTRPPPVLTPLPAKKLAWSPLPASTPAPTLVARVAHVADVHITDDQSPLRRGIFAEAFSGALRSQDAYTCHLLRASVRTMNAIDRETRIDAVVFGGDLVDDSQENEARWFGRILRGEPVACDSGKPDDPVSGAGNDPRDPLVSERLTPPWYFVFGNHDVLIQGVFAITESEKVRVLGDRAEGGTRDGEHPGGALLRDHIVPDPRRRLVDASGLVVALGRPSPSVVDVGKARLVFFDTSADTGGAEGILRAARMEALRTTLRVSDRPTLVFAHHPLDALGNGSGMGGWPQTDALPAADLEHALAEAKSVVGYMVGHAHTHRVRHLSSAVLEIETGALVDWPNEFRVLEVWETEAHRYIVRSVTVPLDTTNDALGRAALDLSVGARVPAHAGSAADRAFAISR